MVYANVKRVILLIIGTRRRRKVAGRSIKARKKIKE
jgi:hypothetical protein